MAPRSRILASGATVSASSALRCRAVTVVCSSADSASVSPRTSPVELAADEIASFLCVGIVHRPLAFADAWRGATGRRAVETRVDVLHRLDVLRPDRPGWRERRGRWSGAIPRPSSPPGSTASSPTCSCEPADPPARADYLRDVLAANGRVVLWTVDGVAVSMARVHAPAVGVSRIGPVYTPPEHRGHGYAAAVTAAAVDDALHRGARDVVLFADAANPVSTGVYRRIGFSRWPSTCASTWSRWPRRHGGTRRSAVPPVEGGTQRVQ